MRLDKFLSHNGFGTRKEVKKIIKDGFVTINEAIITDNKYKIDLDNDLVCVDGELIDYKEEVYYILNKPQDYISSTEDELYPSVLELIEEYRNDLIIVGRLDVDTEGLLLITSDGKFSHNVIHGKKNIYKTYYVYLEKDFDENYIKELETGIILNEEAIKPAKVKVLDKREIELSIAEGKYHQVKKMMHYCDNEVSYLKRIAIGNLELDSSLEPGMYRELDEADLEKIFS